MMLIILFIFVYLNNEQVCMQNPSFSDDPFPSKKKIVTKNIHSQTNKTRTTKTKPILVLTKMMSAHKLEQFEVCGRAYWSQIHYLQLTAPPE